MVPKKEEKSFAFEAMIIAMLFNTFALSAFFGCPISLDEMCLFMFVTNSRHLLKLRTDEWADECYAKSATKVIFINIDEASMALAFHFVN